MCVDGGEPPVASTNAPSLALMPNLGRIELLASGDEARPSPLVRVAREEFRDTIGTKSGSASCASFAAVARLRSASGSILFKPSLLCSSLARRESACSSCRRLRASRSSSPSSWRSDSFDDAVAEKAVRSDCHRPGSDDISRKAIFQGSLAEASLSSSTLAYSLTVTALRSRCCRR